MNSGRPYTWERAEIVFFDYFWNISQTQRTKETGHRHLPHHTVVRALFISYRLLVPVIKSNTSSSLTYHFLRADSFCVLMQVNKLWKIHENTVSFETPPSPKIYHKWILQTPTYLSNRFIWRVFHWPSKSTSPTNLVFPVRGSWIWLMPTSITAAPSLTISVVINCGIPGIINTYLITLAR